MHTPSYTIPTRPCPTSCPFCESQDCAVCNESEQFVRHFMHGPVVKPMSKEEREWCIEEADRAGEGSYPREETEHLNDKDLAWATYRAWCEYVRSNCL